MRVGIGFDAHAFDPSRPLVLAGVTLPDVPGLAGHSDGDVVSHAVADALLGAASLGDLGDHFPADDRWREASSLDILAAAMATVSGRGHAAVNVDVSVVAQAPRLAEHRDKMASNIASTLGIARDAVSIKATTTDGLGFTGRSEGIAAFAVVLIETI